MMGITTTIAKNHEDIMTELSRTRPTDVADTEVGADDVEITEVDVDDGTSTDIDTETDETGEPESCGDDPTGISRILRHYFDNVGISSILRHYFDKVGSSWVSVNYSFRGYMYRAMVEEGDDTTRAEWAAFVVYLRDSKYNKDLRFHENVNAMIADMATREIGPFRLTIKDRRHASSLIVYVPETRSVYDIRSMMRWVGKDPLEAMRMLALFHMEQPNTIEALEQDIRSCMPEAAAAADAVHCIAMKAFAEMMVTVDSRLAREILDKDRRDSRDSLFSEREAADLLPRFKHSAEDTASLWYTNMFTDGDALTDFLPILVPVGGFDDPEALVQRGSKGVEFKLNPFYRRALEDVDLASGAAPVLGDLVHRLMYDDSSPCRDSKDLAVVYIVDVTRRMCDRMEGGAEQYDELVRLAPLGPSVSGTSIVTKEDRIRLTAYHASAMEIGLMLSCERKHKSDDLQGKLIFEANRDWIIGLNAMRLFRPKDRFRPKDILCIIRFKYLNMIEGMHQSNVFEDLEKQCKTIWPEYLTLALVRQAKEYADDDFDVLVLKDGNVKSEITELKDAMIDAAKMEHIYEKMRWSDDLLPLDEVSMSVGHMASFRTIPLFVPIEVSEDGESSSVIASGLVRGDGAVYKLNPYFRAKLRGYERERRGKRGAGDSIRGRRTKKRYGR
jgi:hypothetical protein